MQLSDAAKKRKLPQPSSFLSFVQWDVQICNSESSDISDRAALLETQSFAKLPNAPSPAQLAHQEANAVRRAYAHGAEFWSERAQMMQAWSDYLDGLRAGGTLLPFARTVAS
jgi:hypothetical protein